MTGRDILIVEDENIVALDMRMRLEAMGYRIVDVVDTGDLAIERACSLRPDLVLMDIKLKGEQDGIDVARLLRERSESPVIFVTAFTDERTLERAKRTSPYGYIVKPFHERELRIAIELALYKHQYELSIKKARDAAEEANRVKGEFLANMSHELKTPLNSVIGFTELALSSAQDREQREYLAMALGSARSLLTLIESILDFARMEAGKLEAIDIPFAIDEVLDECCDSLAMRAYAKGLEVSLRRDPRIPDTLVGDASLLKHVVQNLADNAVKFTERGRVTIEATLSAEKDLGDRPVILLRVSDTGIGMPKEKIDYAFSRFTQLDPSRTRKAGGTGLGLAIVAKSVELMGGKLSVDSAEGEGTSFALRIPFGLQDAEASPPRAAPSREGLPPEVLAVDFDDELFVDAALALRRLGVGCRRASLAEALAAGGSSVVLADGRSLEAEISDEELASLAPRLVVATRLGANPSARLGPGAGLACAQMPLRARKLEAAFGLLRARAEVSPAGPPLAASRPRAPAAREPAPASSGAERRELLRRLAAALEACLASEAYAKAEHEAKEAQGALSEIGDQAGARLAFSALLSARKADSGGLSKAVTRIQAAAEGPLIGEGEGE